jgi:hypothetical protein
MYSVSALFLFFLSIYLNSINAEVDVEVEELILPKLGLWEYLVKYSNFIICVYIYIQYVKYIYFI